MILYRHCDRRFPFLWEDRSQPGGRWHGEGDGPAHYFADTPSGAWAEFLRHEGITEESDLSGVERALWVADVPVDPVSFSAPALARPVLIGGIDSYPKCRAEAKRLRGKGAQGGRATSAALLAGGAGGWRVDGGERDAQPNDGEVFVLFGRRPDLVGWLVVESGRPPSRVLPRVRHL